MNIQVLMKQAQKMQQQIAKTEAELKGRTYTAVAGEGLVEVECKGDFKVSKLVISDKLLAENDKEMMEDMVTLAVNEAISKAVAEKAAVMGELTGGVKIPGMI